MLSRFFTLAALLAGQPSLANSAGDLIHDKDAKDSKLEGGAISKLLHSLKKTSTSDRTHKDAKDSELEGGAISKLLHSLKKTSTSERTAESSGDSTTTDLVKKYSVVGDRAESAIALAKKMFDLNMARAMAALSKVSYCGPGPMNFVPYGNSRVFPGLAELSCGSWCEPAGFEFGKVEMVTKTDGTKPQKNADFAYVASVKRAKEMMPAPRFDCVVVFRGTWVSPANVEVDLNTTMIDLPVASCRGTGAKVARGPWGMYMTMKADILKSLKKVGCPAGARIVLTGHSLGGEVATLGMIDLKDNEGYEVLASYTFEAPAPFNDKAVECFEKTMGPHGVSFFRTTSANDEVTRFPFELRQPGFQVWFHSNRDITKYALCGNSIVSPACGTLAMPKDQLCAMNAQGGGNPPSLHCGGYAPFNGPHCVLALAPQGQMCSNAGRSEGLFIGAEIATCMMGGPMEKEAPFVQPAGPVYPPPPPGNDAVKLDAAAMVAAQAMTPAPTPAPLDIKREPSDFFAKLKASYAKKGERMPQQIPCFKAETAASPASMLGHVIEKVSDIYSCQERCKNIAYCEYFMYYHPQGANGEDGSCEVCGGWGQYVPNILGATSGPRDCSKDPPVLDTAEKLALYQEYMAFFGQQTDAHYSMAAFEKNAGGVQSLMPQRYSFGEVVCFGSAMLILGACVTMLLARTGHLAGVFGARTRAVRRPGPLVDERGLVTAEE